MNLLRFGTGMHNKWTYCISDMSFFTNKYCDNIEENDFVAIRQGEKILDSSGSSKYVIFAPISVIFKGPWELEEKKNWSKVGAGAGVRYCLRLRL